MGQEAEIEIQPYVVPQQLDAPPRSAPVPYGVSAPPGSSAPVVAVPAGNALSSVPMWQEEKLGAKCCGCCCDFRRALIIMAIISIISAVVGVFSGTIPFWPAVVGIIPCIASLIGALKFNTCLVGFQVAANIVNFLVGVIMLVVNKDEIEGREGLGLVSIYPQIAVLAVLILLYMYPGIGFIREVRSGIMSAETYPREEFSCCCVNRRY